MALKNLLYPLAVAAVLALPAAAQADSSIVYSKGGDIFLAEPDGSRTYRVTNTGNWSSPSQADDGTIVALGTDDGLLHRMNQRGRELNPPVSVLPGGEGISSPNDPVVSPDGTKVAYWYIVQSGYYNPECDCKIVNSREAWRVTDSNADTPESKYESPGSYVEPSWIDNGRLLVNTVGTYATSLNVATDTVVAGKADRNEGHAGWFTDSSTQGLDLTDGEMTRDFKQMAFVGDDDTSIRFYTVNGFPADVPEPERPAYNPYPENRNPPTPTCTLNFGGAELGNPSWSPDGTRLAVHVAGKGIYIVGAPNPDTCAADPATSLVPVAAQFDWGPADVPAGSVDATGPTLSSLTISPARFRTVRGGGTTISYSVTADAAVALVFARFLPGKRSGPRCVAPTRANRGAKSCKRLKRVPGGIVKATPAGPYSFRFAGKLKGRTLAPGSYRLSAVAVDAAGNQSAVARRGFKVVG